MSRMLTKSLATVVLSASIGGLALSPALAGASAPESAQAVADSGSSSGSGQFLAIPVGLVYLGLCGIYAGSQPDTRPVCIALQNLSSGSGKL
ncbi:hypothetical protein [Nocardia sp. NBC_01327]|uniref:hypothetical protein n=1 Tax=Nocardia sp. NBC_01327 TaxID=2903593 RepID=UPI002E133C08|nr:hypothetical protein OG326_40605 [Nocardia sp. NBC_01327]